MLDHASPPAGPGSMMVLRGVVPGHSCGGSASGALHPPRLGLEWAPTTHPNNIAHHTIACLTATPPLCPSPPSASVGGGHSSDLPVYQVFQHPVGASGFIVGPGPLVQSRALQVQAGSGAFLRSTERNASWTASKRSRSGADLGPFKSTRFNFCFVSAWIGRTTLEWGAVRMVRYDGLPQ